MSINWITLLAQIVNFLILVWILNRIFYRPIQKAMLARQKRIHSCMRDARDAKQVAEAAQTKLTLELAALEGKKEAFLKEAEEAAAALKKDLEGKAHSVVEKEQSLWLESIKKDHDAFLKDLEAHAATEFFALAESGLRDLADEALEEKIVIVFIKQLGELEKGDLQKLKIALEKQEGHVDVETAFSINQHTHTALETCIKDCIGPVTRIDYTQNEKLVAGIRIRIGSEFAQWHIDDYLQQMLRKVKTQLLESVTVKTMQAAE